MAAYLPKIMYPSVYIFKCIWKPRKMSYSCKSQQLRMPRKEDCKCEASLGCIEILKSDSLSTTEKYMKQSFLQIFIRNGYYHTYNSSILEVEVEEFL